MRSMSLALATTQTAKVNAPTYRIEIFDIRSTSSDPTPTTINDIVLEQTLPAIVGPRDFTNENPTFSITERGNYIAGGSIGGDSLMFSIVDIGLVFDPVGGSQSRWLRSGNVVRLFQGDEDVPASDEIPRFTGFIVGRAGATARDRDGNAVLSLVAEDRMAYFLKTPVTSAAFLQSFLFRSMMEEIATQSDVGLDPLEFDFGGIGLSITSQRVTQFVDESFPLALAKIMFIDGFTPRFDGSGFLGIRSQNVQKGPDLFYDDDELFEGFARPASAEDNPNEVAVVGLDANLTKISQDTQELGGATLTLGFFGGDADISVRWSDDGTQQADGARLIVNSSVTGALIPFGSEDFTQLSDPDGSSRSGTISVAGAFYAPLVTSLYGGQLAAHFIPDAWAGIGGGSTIPIGRLVEGAIGISVGIVIATIGRGDYTIIGEPFEMVHQEIRGTARVLNTDPRDVRTFTIENHLFDSQAGVDSASMRELRNSRKRSQTFDISMRHDLRLEVEDKIFFNDTQRSFIITEITQSVVRDGLKRATVKAFETTIGVNP